MSLHNVISGYSHVDTLCTLLVVVALLSDHPTLDVKPKHLSLIYSPH